MSLFPVDPSLIVILAIGSAIGGYLGANMMSAFSEKKIYTLLGCFLFLVGLIVAVKSYNHFFCAQSAGVEESHLPIGLSGIKLVVVSFTACLFGILQSWGLGAFAPTMAVLILFGLNPYSMLPCMYVASGSAIYAGSFKFISTGAYDRKHTPVLVIFGIMGVLVGLIFLKSLDISALRVIMCLILLYVGGEMFVKGLRMRR